MATCRQQDIDEWLATGRTTRTKIRTFVVWGEEEQDQRRPAPRRRPGQEHTLAHPRPALAGIKEPLTGDAESLHYRVAGTLLLLYAQPLVKIVALPAIVVDTDQIRISLGAEPIPVPEPFGDMLKNHLCNRPNLRPLEA